MDHAQFVSLVNQLRDEPHETEWLEFKGVSGRSLIN